MQSHTNKNTASEHKAIAHEHSQEQLPGEGMQIIDNRSEAIAQRKLQEIANSSKQVSQLKAIQAMADRFGTNQQPVQKKENRTSQSLKPNTFITTKQKIIKSQTTEIHPISLHDHLSSQEKIANTPTVQLSKFENTHKQNNNQQSKAAAANTQAQQQNNNLPGQQSQAAAASAQPQQQDNTQKTQTPVANQPSTNANVSFTETTSAGTRVITAVLSAEEKTTITIDSPQPGLSKELMSEISDLNTKIDELTNLISSKITSLAAEEKKEKRQKLRIPIREALDKIVLIKNHIKAKIATEEALKKQKAAEKDLAYLSAHLIQKGGNAELVKDIINAITFDTWSTSKKYDLTDIWKLKSIWKNVNGLVYISNIHSPGENKVVYKPRGVDGSGKQIFEPTICFILIYNGRSYNIHVIPKGEAVVKK